MDLEIVEFECKQFGHVACMVDAHMQVHKWWMIDANTCGADWGNDVHQNNAIQRALNKHMDRMADRLA